MLTVAYICEYAKNPKTVYFKCVNCMVCELYVNKPFFFLRKYKGSYEYKKHSLAAPGRSEWQEDIGRVRRAMWNP